jgi:thiol-disulfide isomerase/thioredoxin
MFSLKVFPLPLLTRVFLLSGVLLLLAGCESPSAVKETAQSRATPANRHVNDYDVQMINVADGQTSSTKLSELVKGKVVVIDFWATWCGPCKKEIPNLVALQQNYRAQGVEVIGLHTQNPPVPKDEVIEMAKAMNINYKVGYVSDEMFAAFARNDRVIPQTYVFNKDGVLVDKFRGSLPNMSTLLKQSVEKALGATGQS